MNAIQDARHAVLRRALRNNMRRGRSPLSGLAKAVHDIDLEPLLTDAERQLITEWCSTKKETVNAVLRWYKGLYEIQRVRAAQSASAEREAELREYGDVFILDKRIAVTAANQPRLAHEHRKLPSGRTYEVEWD